MKLLMSFRTAKNQGAELEVFGWSQSRIPNNTGSQIFLSDSGSPIE